MLFIFIRDANLNTKYAIMSIKPMAENVILMPDLRYELGLYV